MYNVNNNEPNTVARNKPFLLFVVQSFYNLFAAKYSFKNSKIPRITCYHSQSKIIYCLELHQELWQG